MPEPLFLLQLPEQQSGAPVASGLVSVPCIMWGLSLLLSKLVFPAFSAALASHGGLLWLYDEGLITLKSFGLGAQ